MKKINFLMTICVMLVGYTLNSQANDGNGTANDKAGCNVGSGVQRGDSWYR